MTENLVISSQVMSRHLGTEMVILDLRTGTYFGLDGVGLRVWQLLGELRPIDEIVAVLEGEFEVDAATLRADIGELLATLEQKRLLERAPGKSKE